MKKKLCNLFLVLLALGGFAFTAYAVLKNAFPLTTFSNKVISRATSKEVDINQNLSLYLGGMLLSCLLLFLGLKDYIFHITKFIQNKIKSIIATTDKLAESEVFFYSSTLFLSVSMIILLFIDNYIISIFAYIIIILVVLCLDIRKIIPAKKSTVLKEKYGILRIMYTIGMALIAFFNLGNIVSPIPAFFFSLLALGMYGSYKLTKSQFAITKNCILPCIITGVAFTFSIWDIVSYYGNYQTMLYPVLLLSPLLPFFIFCILEKREKTAWILPLLVTPVVFGCINEWFYIQNFSLKTLTFLKMGLLFVTVLFALFPHTKKDSSLSRWSHTLSYPVFLLGILLLCYLPDSVITSPLDYFEQSNYGVGISSFYHFNKIPFLETFDAHMFSDQIGGYLYHLFGGSTFDACFAPYATFITAALIFIGAYFLLCQFTNRENALVLTILVPKYLLFAQLPFSVIVLLSCKNAAKKQTVKSYFLFWILAACSLLYRLDVGACAGVASILVITGYFILSKKKKQLLTLYTCFAATAFAILIPITLLLKQRGIFISGFLSEFINVSLSSNQNWALGEYAFTVTKAFCVYFMGTGILLLFGFFICNYIFKRKPWKKESFTGVPFLLVSIFTMWILNLQRTMLRHNLMEFDSMTILGTGCTILLLFVLFFLKQHTQYKRTTIFLLSLLFLLCFYNGSRESLYNDIVSMKVTRKTERATSSNRVQSKQIYKDAVEMLDTVLQPGETYYDFSNQSMLYVFLQRENPSYVNQSPGLLNGEKSQKQMISVLQQRGDDIPYILMPADYYDKSNIKLGISLDDIPNKIRYFLLSEYIYENYTPIEKTKDFELWAKNDNLDALRQRTQKISNQMIQPIDSIQVASMRKQKNSLGSVPYIWATQYVDHTKDMLPLTKKKESYEVPISQVKNRSGNKLYLTIHSRKDCKITMRIDYPSEDTYEFNLKEGTNNYIIPVGTSYKWHICENATVNFSSKDTFEIKQIAVK